MNGAHLHLLLNHFPVTGIIFSFFLLLYGVIKKNSSIVNAGLSVTIIISFFAIAAYFTGEEAEHTISKIIGINRDAIEEHQQLAIIALWIFIFNGTVACITLVSWFKSMKLWPLMLYINLSLQLAGIIVVSKTALTGGLIRHTEINIPASQ